ncbi:MAG: ABC transporter ATP-binding protein [Rickettsiales bacterium]|nr:ABC transporter ATP-binding protein [Rickettsiales bacterium]
MNEIVVNCVDVKKVYGNNSKNPVVALSGINLEVYKGELFMLVGPSGCGKTTLISVIAGILNSSSGKCEVLSKNLNNLSQRELLEFRAKNIGFVFQSFNLLPALTSAENVAVPLLINGLDRESAVKKAKEILRQVGLEGKENSLPNQLSGGQQQRVAIARALIHNPKIIVCDEPTSALDNVTGQKVIELMQDICKKFGNTMLVVTHDSRIYKYADRIAHMDDGKIISIE